jgi:hypothetical protein
MSDNTDNSLLLVSLKKTMLNDSAVVGSSLCCVQWASSQQKGR